MNYRQQRSNQFLFRWIWTLFNKSFNFDSAEFWQFCNETLDFTVSLSRLFTISFVFYWFLRTVVKSLTVIGFKKNKFSWIILTRKITKILGLNRQQFHEKNKLKFYKSRVSDILTRFSFKAIWTLCLTVSEKKTLSFLWLTFLETRIVRIQFSLLLKIGRDLSKYLK